MNNVMKFQAPFERLKEHSSTPEIALFKAIIMQALTDATSVSERSKDIAIEKEAKNWIYSNDDYFQMVCHFGELEPTFVIKIVQEAVRLNKQRHSGIKGDFQDKKNYNLELKAVSTGK